MVSRHELSAIVVAVAMAALSIESGHRIEIAPRTPAEQALIAAAEACPASDNVPYSARCIAFLGDTDGTAIHGQAIPASDKSATTVSRPGESAVRAAPCPDNDNQPYSASCLVFMKGATELGMRWRVDTADPRAAVRAGTAN